MINHARCSNKGDNVNIEKTISRQIAHCMAFYGDKPEELMIKLETLVMEWYIKGKTGLMIYCPECCGG